MQKRPLSLGAQARRIRGRPSQGLGPHAPAPAPPPTHPPFVLASVSQLLAQEEASLQSVWQQLNQLGLPEAEVAAWVCDYPSLLVREVAAEQMPMLRRMYETRIGRYTQSGSYEV